MERLFVFTSIIAVCCGATWDYGDPSTWATDHPDCGGSNQSPINVVSSSAEEKEIPVLLEGYSTSVKWSIENNGHTVGAVLRPGNSGTYEVQAPDAYTNTAATWSLAQFHFHWGSVNTQGSENTIDGKMYPMEVHFVHVNNKYEASLAGGNPDGYLVLGFMFEIGADNVAFNKIVQTLTLTKNKGHNETLTGDLAPNALIAGVVETNEFFYWKGSLTTPSCNEAVTWVLYRKPIVISQAQMNVVRTALFENEAGETEKSMNDNWRPVQPLNTRTVYKNKVTEKDDGPGENEPIPCGTPPLTGGMLLVVASLISSFLRR